MGGMANITTLSPWSLGELGFVTLDKKPESFDLIDGKKHPNNVVKGILGQMYKAAKADPRTGSALNQYNYERLLKQIDKNNDSQFSEEEYLQAIQLPAYRDHLYRIIAKHPSEWWYGKDDPLWKTYLDTLTEDASTWKTYLETFIERLTWMKQVAGMGPDPWHMHPVVFLDALKPKNRRKRRDNDLGSLSARYETGGRGSLTVSGGVGDAGGVSYGSYQMTSQVITKVHGVQTVIIGGTVKRFVNSNSFPWRDEFNGLTPGSVSFTSKWKELVNAHTSQFTEVEHQFIKETHYDKLVEYILKEKSVDVRYHSHTLNDVVWSTAVQNGATTNVINNAIAAVGGKPSETKAYDEALINAIYDERGRKKPDGNLVYFSRNSPAVQAGVSGRFLSENKIALEKLSNENDY